MAEKPKPRSKPWSKETADAWHEAKRHWDRFASERVAGIGGAAVSIDMGWENHPDIAAGPFNDAEKRALVKFLNAADAESMGLDPQTVLDEMAWDWGSGEGRGKPLDRGLVKIGKKLGVDLRGTVKAAMKAMGGEEGAIAGKWKLQAPDEKGYDSRRKLPVAVSQRVFKGNDASIPDDVLRHYSDEILSHIDSWEDGFRENPHAGEWMSHEDAMSDPGYRRLQEARARIAGRLRGLGGEEGAITFGGDKPPTAARDTLEKIVAGDKSLASFHGLTQERAAHMLSAMESMPGDPASPSPASAHRAREFVAANPDVTPDIASSGFRSRLRQFMADRPDLFNEEGAITWDPRQTAEENARRFFKDVAEETGKSRHFLAYMPPDEFLGLARPFVGGEGVPEKPRSIQEIREALAADRPLHDVPSLHMNPRSGQVRGHEGRHRATVLKEMGVPRMPVRVHGDSGTDVLRGRVGPTPGGEPFIMPSWEPGGRGTFLFDTPAPPPEGTLYHNIDTDEALKPSQERIVIRRVDEGPPRWSEQRHAAQEGVVPASGEAGGRLPQRLYGERQAEAFGGAHNPYSIESPLYTEGPLRGAVRPEYAGTWRQQIAKLGGEEGRAGGLLQGARNVFTGEPVPVPQRISMPVGPEAAAAQGMPQLTGRQAARSIAAKAAPWAAMPLIDYALNPEARTWDQFWRQQEDLVTMLPGLTPREKYYTLPPDRERAVEATQGALMAPSYEEEPVSLDELNTYLTTPGRFGEYDEHMPEWVWRMNMLQENAGQRPVTEVGVIPSVTPVVTPRREPARSWAKPPKGEPRAPAGRAWEGMGDLVY